MKLSNWIVGSLVASFIGSSASAATFINRDIDSVSGKLLVEPGLELISVEAYVGCRIAKPDNTEPWLPKQSLTVHVADPARNSDGTTEYSFGVDEGNFWTLIPWADLKACGYRLVVSAKHMATGQVLTSGVDLIGSTQTAMVPVQLEALMDQRFWGAHASMCASPVRVKWVAESQTGTTIDVTRSGWESGCRY